MIFSNGRRSLLAKTFMDIAKLLAAAGFATLFFKGAPMVVRVGLAVFFVGLILIGLLTMPAIPEKEEGE